MLIVFDEFLKVLFFINFSVSFSVLTLFYMGVDVFAWKHFVLIIWCMITVIYKTYNKMFSNSLVLSIMNTDYYLRKNKISHSYYQKKCNSI